MTNQEQEDLMVRAAWLYYDDELTHEQIAQQLGLSRIAVTRLLQRARRDGIVQIKITRALPPQRDLERRLQATFGLQRAIVVKTRGTLDETLDDIGWVGAEYLKQYLWDGCRIGVGWSTTVRRMAPYLEAPPQGLECIVNDLAGSYLGHANPYSMSVQLAQVLGAPLEALPVPAVMQSQAARDAVLHEQPISAALDHAGRSDIAIVGLGDVGSNTTLVQTGYMTPKQITAVREQGAVGDMLLHFFDNHGTHVPTPLEAQTIAITWEQMRRIPHVVALAAGSTKVDPILGAVRGELCQCLITDTETAQQVLERQVGTSPSPDRSMREPTP